MKRECGDCQACCTVLPIHAASGQLHRIGLVKPANVTCEHVGQAGCTKYNQRPEPCEGFECLWLNDSNGEVLRLMERPDKSGAMVTVKMLSEVFPNGPHEWQTVKVFFAHESKRKGFEEAAPMLAKLSRWSLVFMVQSPPYFVQPNQDGFAAKVIGPKAMLDEVNKYRAIS